MNPSPLLLIALVAALAAWLYSRTKSGSAMVASILKRFEGLRLTPYKDAAGLWTIGYGHLIAAGDPYYPQGERKSITAAEAERLLQDDILRTWAPAKTAIRVSLSPTQAAALQSLVFNIGPQAFVKSSLPGLVNSLAFQKAADAFLLFNKLRDPAGKLVASAGLTARRQAERQLFLS